MKKPGEGGREKGAWIEGKMNKIFSRLSSMDTKIEKIRDKGHVKKRRNDLEEDMDRGEKQENTREVKGVPADGLGHEHLVDDHDLTEKLGKEARGLSLRDLEYGNCHPFKSAGIFLPPP